MSTQTNKMSTVMWQYFVLTSAQSYNSIFKKILTHDAMFLQEHGFIRRSEAEQVDMAAWFADVSSLMEVSRFT